MLLRYLSLMGLLVLASGASAQDAARPNIVWITAEDHGPHLGCYGDAYATTPHLDAFAARGMIFDRCWSVVPVCAPARTTLITGVYPSSLGAEHMRSLVRLPEGMTLFPSLLREAGYYCTNNVKEDYNVVKPAGTWDESSPRAHWRHRGAGQPFFAVFNFTGTHESQIRKRPHRAVHDPARVRVPAYHPDVSEVRTDWAQYYDQLTAADEFAQGVLDELAADGLDDETIVFYLADHGPGLPRSKRSACDSGVRVPLVVVFPKRWKHLAPSDYRAGSRSSRLVSFVDLAPTVLSLAGIEPPAWMQGGALAGKHAAAPPEFLHGLRGRMDERYDTVRCVTDGRYVYVRNYRPELPAGQHVEYMFKTPATQVWKQMFEAGQLTDIQARFWRPRVAEELYDLKDDPDEVNNLVGSTEHAEILARLRCAQREQAVRVRDVGLLPEAEMRRRAGDDAPSTLACDDARYPLARVLVAAELASTAGAEQAEQVAALLNDGDAGVRWWGAIGLGRLGQAGLAEAALREALADPSPSVRIAVAEALDEPGAIVATIEQFRVELAVVLEGLNALERLNLTAVQAPGLAAMRASLATPDAAWEPRAREAVEKLLRVGQPRRPRG